MRKLILLQTVLLCIAIDALGQCDSLLTSTAYGRTVCANEFLSLDLASMEYRKGGNWYSKEFGSITTTTVHSKVSYSQYFYYSYTDNNSNCTTLDSIFVKVNDVPKISMSKLPDVCANEKPFSLVLNASPSGGIWSGDSMLKTYVKNNQFHPSLVDMSAGKSVAIPIFYTYTDPITKCSASNWTAITVVPLPYLKLVDTVQMAIKDSVLDLRTIINSKGHKTATWSGEGVVSDQGIWLFSAPEVGNKKGFYELEYSFTDRSTPTQCSVKDTIVLHLVDSLVTVSAKEAADENEFEIYPNPSNGQVFLMSSTPFQYHIYHINGALISKSQTAVSQHAIDLKKGIYWVVMSNAAGELNTRKLVIQ